MYIRSRSNSEMTVSPVSLKKKKRINIIIRQAGEYFLCCAAAGVVLVGEVAGVVDPHQFIETAAPPGGQLQSHVEGVFSLRLLVPPEESVTLNLDLLLRVKSNGGHQRVPFKQLKLS